jgi:hypothetical protein
MTPRHLLSIGFLLLGLGCFGTNRSGDRAGTVNEKMTILPESPSLVAGQTIQFSASTPWGNEAIWSVMPATAGTISTTGLFTAATTTPTGAMVLAVWAKDVRYAASTHVSILAPPAPAETSPQLVQASGVQQTVPGTAIANAVVVGEATPAITATSANGAVTVRHGFDPPVK